MFFLDFQDDMKMPGQQAARKKGFELERFKRSFKAMAATARTVSRSVPKDLERTKIGNNNPRPPMIFGKLFFGNADFRAV